jgi:excisionase family DNA binding protein
VTDTYTTREVAQMLGMAVRSVQMMVDRGELEAWKTPGGHRRISRLSVDRWRSSRGMLPAGGEQAPAPGPVPAPAAGAAKPGEPPQAAPPAPTRRATDSTIPRVLLIEDSVHYQNLVSLLLRQQFPGVQLHIADDGIAGLALAGQLRPHVLVVDILLPGIDGGTLITSLRSHPQFASTKLIVVTSLGEVQREPYAFALAGVPVVHKPRLVIDLPPLLRSYLPQATAEAAA